MNKVALLSWMVILLAILNITILTVFCYRTPDPSRPPRQFRDQAEADRFIRETFDFDAAQLQKFRQSKQRQMLAVRDTERQLRLTSHSFYLLSSEKPGLKDSLMTKIQQLNRDIYRINDRHFQEVRAICRPDQVGKLDGFINGLLRGNDPGKNRG